jgi:hypothetical protein
VGPALMHHLAANEAMLMEQRFAFVTFLPTNAF